MSELMNLSRNRRNIWWQLLTTVSAFALLGSAKGTASTSQDSDRPTVWIELGGQLEHVDGGQEAFSPAFFNTIVQNGFRSPLDVDRPARYSDGLQGKLSFLPHDSDWTFSGSVRYGRSNGDRFLHQQPPAIVSQFPFFGFHQTKTAASYAQTKADNSESHVIVDFQAGKDVGMGMFGGGSTSVVSFGVRFAQFNSKSSATIAARPDDHFVPTNLYGYQVPLNFYHQYYGTFSRAMSFRGVGPSISWNASVPLGENERSGGATFDWGVNAAILFGRQKTQTHHHSSGSYHYYQGKYHALAQLPGGDGNGDRNRSVVVPNVGGFAGVSFRYDQAKISFGYRADFFFGAIDGGLDTRKTYNRDFYGPFATISVGLGG